MIRTCSGTVIMTPLFLWIYRHFRPGPYSKCVKYSCSPARRERCHKGSFPQKRVHNERYPEGSSLAAQDCKNIQRTRRINTDSILTPSSEFDTSQLVYEALATTTVRTRQQSHASKLDHCFFLILFRVWWTGHKTSIVSSSTGAHINKMTQAKFKRVYV